MIDKFSFERIHVHVMKFLGSIHQTPDIIQAGSNQSPHPKIMEAALPESLV
jgi:hypothetical protein